jgi:hypothetical protein
MSFTSSPHEANHQRHYLPAIEHARLEAALKGRPLPNVLPHSIEAGKDPYYIGNAYRRLQYNPWHLDTYVSPPPVAAAVLGQPANSPQLWTALPRLYQKRDARVATS